MFKEIYNVCENVYEMNRVAKIQKAWNDGAITSYNFWDYVRKLAKNLTSDHAIGRWQALSEMCYDIMFEPEDIPF